MNSITDTYLTFRVNNVIEYIKLLAEEERITSKIPKQLNKLIYKYYDLFILTNKEVDYEKIKIRTGLNDTNERLILFYLLIEFDLTSRLELSDKKLYDLYNFIVNSIIVFIDLEKNISKNTEQYSYENSIKRTLKKYEGNIEYLINNNFNVTLSTNKTLTKNQIYKKIKYLFIEYNDDLKDDVESAQKLNLEIIIKGNIKNNKNLDNLMYVN